MDSIPRAKASPLLRAKPLQEPATRSAATAWLKHVNSACFNFNPKEPRRFEIKSVNDAEEKPCSIRPTPGAKEDAGELPPARVVRIGPQHN